jgi:hypothetical protein
MSETHTPGDCITAGAKPVCEACLEHLPPIEYEPVREKAKPHSSRVSPPERRVELFSPAVAAVDREIMGDWSPSYKGTPEQDAFLRTMGANAFIKEHPEMSRAGVFAYLFLAEYDACVLEQESHEHRRDCVVSIGACFDGDTCRICGLTFPNGVRRFKTWGTPNVTKQAHYEFHRTEAAAQDRTPGELPKTTYGTGRPAPRKGGGKAVDGAKYVTLRRFKRHAKIHGPEAVLETARAHLSTPELRQLGEYMEKLKQERPNAHWRTREAQAGTYIPETLEPEPVKSEAAVCAVCKTTMGLRSGRRRYCGPACKKAAHRAAREAREVAARRGSGGHVKDRSRG